MSLKARRNLVAEFSRNQMVMPAHLIRPEMITLKRKKIKAKPDDKSDYEDCPDDDYKSIPTVERMQTEAYLKAMQREAEHEAKIRAMIVNQYKWDVNEFNFFEKQVPVEFKFSQPDSTKLAAMYDSVILWMKQGWRPRHIEANTLKNYTAFGRDGFLKRDIATICSWCDGLAALERAIMQDELVFLAKSEGTEDMQEFDREEV